MSFRVRCCFVLLALLLASATTALGTQDPELTKCKQQCRVRRFFDKEKLRKCLQKCEDDSREKHRREHGGSGGSGASEEVEEEDQNRRSPIERLRECTRGCERQQGEQREHCQRRCQEEYEREKERYEGGGSDNPTCVEYCSQEHQGDEQVERCVVKCEERRREGGGREGELDEKYERRGREEEEEEEWRQGQGQGQNPYVFEDRHFYTGMQTQHGRLRVLQKFTERSRLFRGIENYRVGILEAQPQTFVVPNHWDADRLVFVARGRGTVNIVRQDSRESFNIREGDIFRIKAGTTAYLINTDDNERLVLAKLLLPVNTPGEFEAFFGAGGENPQSFYRAFSNEILEASFNTRVERFQRLFSQQRQGVILKASQEQIRAMSHHEEGRIWPFGGELKGAHTHNIYEKRPTRSNQYGELYWVDSRQFSQLRDLDIAISLANITQGAMTAPHYNTKSTRIAIVVDGEGYFEMVCPHLSQSSQGHHQGSEEERYESEGETMVGTSYQRVRSRLRPGTVVVVPAGHPFVAVASSNQNLQFFCFEVNAYDNEKIPLAGKRNVINQLEKEAKELAFGMPAREVDDIFRSQEEMVFFRGPRQQQQGRSDW